MQKNIKDYLHLYVGCEIAFSEDNYKYKGFHLTNSFISQQKQYEFKPILRLLTNMTNEERIEFVTLINIGILHINIPNQNNNFHTEQFLYLLKKGFDLFGLIEAGLAIDKSKIN